MYRINELEDAIISILNAASISAKSFNREPNEKEISKVVKTKPSVLIVYNRASRSKVVTSSLKGVEFYFHLYLLFKNLRSPSSAARGDLSSSGLYEYMELVKQTLSDSSLGLNMQPMEWILEKPIIRTAKQSVYLQEWKIEVFQ